MRHRFLLPPRRPGDNYLTAVEGLSVGSQVAAHFSCSIIGRSPLSIFAIAF
jgi:hypothetical protein